MGICVYWSCRHVVFVKRCNCSFYLTVGEAGVLVGTESEVHESLNVKTGKSISDFVFMPRERNKT